MAGPWDKYASSASSAEPPPSGDKPWHKYRPDYVHPDDIGDAQDGGYLGEGLSGVNEGIANTTSLPSMIVKDALSIGPAIVNAFGGHAAYPDYVPDPGPAVKAGMEKVGMIKPASQDPGKKFVRRVGQEVGAALVPGIGLAAKAEAPVRMLATELGSALGSGTGAATAEQIAPGNAGAEMAGQIIGGLSPVALTTALRRSAVAKAAPTVAELEDQAGAKYDAARASGAVSTKPMNQMLSADMKTIAVDEGLISPTGRVAGGYPKLKDVLDTFDDFANGTMSVKQMQTVRRTLQDAASSADKGERRIAMRMLEAFDAHTSQLAPALAEGNAIYTKAKRGEMIDKAIELAGSRAGQFSGSGFENALRTEFRGLERQIIKGQLKGVPPDVADAISKVARGGGLENISRWVGKFAPSGNVSTVGGAMLGNALGGPVGAGAALGIGAAGRSLATKLTAGNAAKASAIARRGNALTAPFFNADEGRALSASAAGAVANQNANQMARKSVTLRELMNGN